MSDKDVLAAFEEPLSEDEQAVLAAFEEDDDGGGVTPPAELSGGEAQPFQAPTMTAGEVARLGLGQGMLLKHGDEFAGGVEYGLDLAAKQGLVPGVERSPTEVNAELAAQGFTGDLGPTSSEELYRQSRDEERAKLHQAAQEQPGLLAATEFAGGMLIPGGIAGKTMRGSGVIGGIAKNTGLGAGVGGIVGGGASEADLTKDEYGDYFKDMLTGAGYGSLIGGGIGLGTGLVKGAANLGKSKQLEKTQEFMNPTATQMGKQEFPETIAYLNDEILLPLKKQQKQISREELRDHLIAKREAVGGELGQMRKQSTTMSKKDLDALLKTRQDEIEKTMSRQDKLDFIRARKEVFPTEYKKLARQEDALVAEAETLSAQINAKSEKLAETKAKAVNISTPSLQSKLEGQVSALEKEIAELETNHSALIKQKTKLDDQLTKLEDGDVTLQDLFDQKKNLKRPDWSGEGERLFRGMENKEGGSAFQRAKSEYEMLEDLVPMAERSTGKFKKDATKDLPFIPLGKMNKVMKGLSYFLPKHQETLKLAGFKPTSKILRNEKYREMFKKGLDSGGGLANVASTIYVMQRRDPLFKKLWEEEQKERDNEE